MHGLRQTVFSPEVIDARLGELQKELLKIANDSVKYKKIAGHAEFDKF